MRFLNPFLIVCTIVLMVLSACASDDNDVTIDPYLSTNTAITEFRLKADDSVLTNLDSVFFAIDLTDRTVYNPDSLPYGTKINSLSINPTITDVYRVEIVMPLEDGRDTTFLYVKSTEGTAYDTDQKLNFTNGPVTLRITALDTTVVVNYQVKVNVHTTIPDSLYWDAPAMRRIPDIMNGASLFGATKAINPAANTVDPFIFTVSADAAGNAVVTADPAANIGNGSTISFTQSFPAGVDPSSLCSTPRGVQYMIADGRLISSADGWHTWTDCNTPMTYLYGAQLETAVGALKGADGTWTLATYPSTGDATPIPAGCPVAATTQMITYTTQWSNDATSIVTGGRCADGSLAAGTWSFDGTSWNAITLVGLPALEGMMMVPSKEFRLNSQWIASEHSLLMAFGGRDADGELNTCTYVSYDLGLHWKKGSELIQLPEDVAPRYGARVFVCDRTATDAASRGAVASGDWRMFRPLALPPFVRKDTGIPSRYTTDVTSWEVPYIYMYGGYDANDAFLDQLWRAVLMRLSYKPLF